MYSMQNSGQFCSALGALKQVPRWAYGKTTKRDAL